MRRKITRFALLPKPIARLILASFAGLLAYGLLHSPEPPPPESQPEEGVGDVYLYEAIVDRVRAGEGYYSAAGKELRLRGYDVHPFITWRLPTSARVIAAFRSNEDAAWVLRILSFFGILISSLRLYHATSSVWRAVAGTVFLAGALGMTLNDYAVFFHEIWAMTLVTISLALHHPRYWIGSVVLGTVALLFRELVLVFVGAMMLAAWIGGRRREVIGWICGLTVFFLALNVHAHAVSGTASGDGPGASWFVFGGWPFVLTTAKWNLFLILSPAWVTAVFVPLALLGAIAWKHRLGLQVSLILGLYLSAYLIVGNPENAYWGMLYAPFLALGVPHCLDGLRDLWVAAKEPPATLTG